MLNKPKLHHYVPQFYLRRFAAGKKRHILCHKRDKVDPITMTVRNAAAETGFYDVELEDGTVSKEIEIKLAELEDKVKPMFEMLVNSGAMLTGADRNTFAYFMAMQKVRTRLQRIEQESIIPAMIDALGVDKSQLRFDIDFTQNEHIEMMIDLSVRLAPIIAERHWVVLKSLNHDFITSDNPFVYHTPDEFRSKHLGTGLGNALEIYFPLGPKHALLLSPINATPMIKDPSLNMMIVNEQNVLYINHLVARLCMDWVFQRPKSQDITKILPKAPRVLGVINNVTPIYATSPQSTWQNRK